MAVIGRQTVAAILVAAGSGRRLGRGPKAFVEIEGQPLVVHAVRRFVVHPRVRDVVLVVPAGVTADNLDAPDNLGDQAEAVTVVTGGARRQDSVANGLAALAEDIDVVLVHDVARAFVPLEVIDRVLDALANGADGAVPVLPVADTIRAIDADSGELGVAIERSTLAGMQTPQGFSRTILERAHAAGDLDVTDDVALVQVIGGRVVAVDGADEAFKITRLWDLQVAEAMMDYLDLPDLQDDAIAALESQFRRDD